MIFIRFLPADFHPLECASHAAGLQLFLFTLKDAGVSIYEAYGMQPNLRLQNIVSQDPNELGIEIWIL